MHTTSPRLLRHLAGLLAILTPACGTSSPEDPVAPSGLSYPAAVTSIRVGVWAPALRPVLARGLADRFTVVPTLPPGLVLDAQTGEVSGVPTAPYPAETYVVTAFNAYGDTQAVFELGVEATFDRPRFAYVAGFTDHTVSTFAIDGSTGQLVATGYVPSDTGPADLAASPNGDQLYVTNLQSGRLSHYSIDPADGQLTLRSHQVSGPGAVGVVVHPTLSVLYTINSGGDELSGVDDPAPAESDDPKAAVALGSSVRAFRIDAATGAPTPLDDPLPAGGPVALALHPSGNMLYVANFANNTLGGYSIDASGSLAPRGNLAVGEAPVSLALHPSGNFLFLTCIRSDELMLFELDAEGTPTLLQSLPTEDGPIDLVASADGSRVVVSCTGAGELGYYAFDQVSRTLTLERRETTAAKPFQLLLDPLSEQLYTTHLDTGEVSTYRSLGADFELNDRRVTRGAASGIALVSGALAQTRTSPVTWAVSGLHEVETLDVEASGFLTDRARPLPSGETPDVLVRHPHGHALYVLASGSNDISTYAIDPETFDLTPLGPPVFAGSAATDLIVESRGQWAYASVEGGVQGFELTPGGVPEPAQFFPAGSSLGDLVMHCAGRFVYALDRVENVIHTFDINPLTCKLRPASVGPFAFANAPGGTLVLHPSGRYLFATRTESDSVTRFAIAPKTGALSDPVDVPTGAGPGALAVHPSGDLLLVAHAASGNIHAFHVDSLGLVPTLLDALTVGREPSALTFEASGARAFVANLGSDSVSVIDLGWETDDPGSFTLDVESTLELASGSAPRGLLAPWAWIPLIAAAAGEAAAPSVR